MADTFVKLKSDFWRNEKIRNLTPGAGWLHVLALSYCKHNYHTDGFLTKHDLGVLRPNDKNRTVFAKNLVEAGLWEKVDGGWQVHDWLDHNQSAESIRQAKKRGLKVVGN